MSNICYDQLINNLRSADVNCDILLEMCQMHASIWTLKWLATNSPSYIIQCTCAYIHSVIATILINIIN